jgi:hypothetical protein
MAALQTLSRALKTVLTVKSFGREEERIIVLQTKKGIM